MLIGVRGWRCRTVRACAHRARLFICTSHGSSPCTGVRTTRRLLAICGLFFLLGACAKDSYSALCDFGRNTPAIFIARRVIRHQGDPQNWLG